MSETTLKAVIGLIAALTLSACATHRSSDEAVAEQVKRCQPTETLSCDKFAGETYNCTCEKGDNLRDMLDAYRMPDY